MVAFWQATERSEVTLGPNVGGPDRVGRGGEGGHGAPAYCPRLCSIGTPAAPAAGPARPAMDDRPRNLRTMLSEAKDTSELMVDLAYAALYFGDPDMAEEVQELETKAEGTANRREVPRGNS